MSGGMHGRGKLAWQGEACMAGEGCAWQGVVHGRECVWWGHEWQGACMAGGMHGGGAWQGGMCGRGACVAGGHVWQRADTMRYDQ